MGVSLNALLCRTVTTKPLRHLPILIDDELLEAMFEEGEAVGDDTVEATIARRLTQGVALAELAGPGSLLWRPVRCDAFQLEIALSAETTARVSELADRCGYGVATLVCTILYNDVCKPWEVRQFERASASAPLRQEPGRGNIYATRFELPGYQLVFIRMLAGHFSRRDAIVREAILALARQVQRTAALGDAPVSDEALEFARKMVRIEDLQHAR